MTTTRSNDSGNGPIYIGQLRIEVAVQACGPCCKNQRLPILGITLLDAEGMYVAHKFKRLREEIATTFNIPDELTRRRIGEYEDGFEDERAAEEVERDGDQE